MDIGEQYAYRFGGQQVSTVKRALPCGDYGVAVAGRLVAAVERKSLSDLASSLINGKLRSRGRRSGRVPTGRRCGRGPLLAGVQTCRVRPAVVADGLAELQVRSPSVPIVFAETRSSPRNGPTATSPPLTPGPKPNRRSRNVSALHSLARTQRRRRYAPSTAEVRAWAHGTGITAPGRGRLHPDIWQAWRDAQPG